MLVWHVLRRACFGRLAARRTIQLRRVAPRSDRRIVLRGSSLVTLLSRERVPVRSASLSSSALASYLCRPLVCLPLAGAARPPASRRRPTPLGESNLFRQQVVRLGNARVSSDLASRFASRCDFQLRQELLVERSSRRRRLPRAAARRFERTRARPTCETPSVAFNAGASGLPQPVTPAHGSAIGSRGESRQWNAG